MRGLVVVLTQVGRCGQWQELQQETQGNCLWRDPLGSKMGIVRLLW
jgi:type IV pilus biogenesis protein CpaD/CtpE